jgi:hypothetical protein
MLITITHTICTPVDRAAHIEACKTRDIQSCWGLVTTEGYYERLGDQASVNCWYYHDSTIGFHRLYANTPDWIVALARKMCWISNKGTRVKP